VYEIFSNYFMGKGEKNLIKYTGKLPYLILSFCSQKESRAKLYLDGKTDIFTH